MNIAARGALGGAFWGTLVGLIFLNPLLGLAAGAATGAAAGALSDYGISDTFMRDLGATMRPGTSAIFVLVRRATVDKLHAELGSHGGKLLHTSLTPGDEARLRERLAVAAISSELPPVAATVSLPAG